MGANESRTHGGAGGNAGVAEESYYELLGIPEDADQDQIKKAFRKLALIHHPDKNPNDLEEATKRFAILQQAYEVLSDEQERAFYDSHRASLAPEPDADDVFEEIRRGTAPSGRRDRGLTVRHLARFFSPSAYTDLDDGENGFFTIYRHLFARLAADEAQHGQTDPLPAFGDSTWPWVPPSKAEAETATRTFYTFWTNFVTEKDFTWTEMWNLADAPDRRVRRLMEKDNQKAREDARREYNDTVRSLALFLRKRDPRYKAHQAQLNANPSGTSTPSAAAAAQRRAAATSAYVEQAWQAPDQGAAGNQHVDLEWAVAEGGDDEQEWECVVCGKAFRSEAAWDSHERSKKHLKEVERLKLEMQLEDEELGLGGAEAQDGEDVPPPESASEGEDDAEPIVPVVVADPTSAEADTDERPPRARQAQRKAASAPLAPDSDTDEVPRSRKKGKRARRKDPAEDLFEAAEEAAGTPEPEAAPVDAEVGNEGAAAVPELSKRDKRRAREAAKKAREDTFACNVCHEPFESKTALFAHLRDAGHAAAEPVRSDAKGGKAPKAKKGKR